MDRPRTHPSPHRRFEVLDVAHLMNETICPLVQKIRRRSRKLANQIEDAAQSVPANLSEGNRRLGKDRGFHFSVAAGSADETRNHLRTAVAWRYLTNADCAKSLELLDRILAMTWKLTH